MLAAAAQDIVDVLRAAEASIPDMTAMTAAACLVARTLVPPACGIRTPGDL